MPLYDYLCGVCGTTAEAFRPMAGRLRGPRCAGCAGKTTLLIGQQVRASRFREYVEWNIDSNPVLIKSARHLEAECEKRGLAIVGGQKARVGWATWNETRRRDRLIHEALHEKLKQKG